MPPEAVVVRRSEESRQIEAVIPDALFKNCLRTGKIPAVLFGAGFLGIGVRGR